MRTNPFAPEKQHPFTEKTLPAASAIAPPSVSPPASEGEQAFAEPKAKAPSRCFIKCAALASAVFLVAALFVFREVQHTRELYQMSRLVAQAEAQKRQWQEKQRLEEARAAGFLAALHSQQSWPQDIRNVKATYTVAMHWR